VAGTCGYGEGLSSSINAGNFLTSCKVYWLASQEGLCSMESVSNFIVDSAVSFAESVTDLLFSFPSLGHPSYSLTLYLWTLLIA
jgi:hypothetical protein